MDNSIKLKIEELKRQLQRLIDIPSDKWTKEDNWYNENKPIYVTDNICVDIIEDEVVIIYESE